MYKLFAFLVIFITSSQGMMNPRISCHDVTPEERLSYFNKKEPVVHREIAQKININLDDFLNHNVVLGSLFSHRFSSIYESNHLKSELSFIWDSYLANCAANYLFTYPWPTMLSYELVEPFFPIIACIQPRLDYNTQETIDTFDVNANFGSYVLVTLPGRNAFVTDALAVEGDVVSLGAGLTYDTLSLLPKAGRLILNDLNILPLLLTAYKASQDPLLAPLAREKLILHHGRAEDLRLPPNSVQKYYAGYLIKYLQQSQLKALFKNITESLAPMGRLYIEELNKQHLFYRNNNVNYYAMQDLLPLLGDHKIIRYQENSSNYKFNKYSMIASLTWFFITSKEIDNEKGALTPTLPSWRDDVLPLKEMMRVHGVCYTVCTLSMIVILFTFIHVSLHPA